MGHPPDQECQQILRRSGGQFRRHVRCYGGDDHGADRPQWCRVKTTLFNCITGYYPPSKGEIIFNGRTMNRLRPDAVCRLGMARTWQKVRPLAKMSVVDNVMVGALCRTNSLKKAREMAMEQLRIVSLEHRATLLAGGPADR